MIVRSQTPVVTATLAPRSLTRAVGAGVPRRPAYRGRGHAYGRLGRQPTGMGDTIDLGDSDVQFGGAPVTTPITINTPAGPNYGQQFLDIFKSILPAGMTTLQEWAAQPGQTIRTPTTLITGPGTNLLSTAGSVSTGTWMILGVLGLGAVLLMGKK